MPNGGPLFGHQLRHRAASALQAAHDAGRPAGYDQRRTRLVHQHLVGLVHDSGEQRALHRRVGRQPEIVSQKVEPELPQRAVDDVPAVGGRALRVGHRAEHGAHVQAESLEGGGEQVGVARGQVVVGGYHVDGPALQGVESGWKRRRDGLALARVHLDHGPAVHQQARGDLLARGSKARPIRLGQPAGQRLAHHGGTERQLALAAVAR